MEKARKATYETGVRGEEIAEAWLTARGMRCLERRYREKAGEIDLIMEDGETIVFVEVKTRFSTAAGGGLSAVTPAKQRRIAKCATLYAMKHDPHGEKGLRFDVIEINREGVTHLPNAFQPGGMVFR